ncbi:hypothetical protein BYT27DRAFT_7258757 [Phlegmacium glaucopus]|nr:hypothetical protein BYT27DRAFT_7258757 [Phlegmacium glaucopus]
MNNMMWDAVHYHIRCLAHIINLTTQAVIAGYSKTKLFNPEQPDEHIIASEPSTEALESPSS